MCVNSWDCILDKQLKLDKAIQNIKNLFEFENSCANKPFEEMSYHDWKIVCCGLESCRNVSAKIRKISQPGKEIMCFDERKFKLEMELEKISLNFPALMPEQARSPLATLA